MSLLIDLTKFSKAYRTYTVRQERIKREGSPYYAWDVGALAAGVATILRPNRDLPGSKKYSPLDWIEIINNSTEVVTITVNGTERFISPAGTIRTVTDLPLHQVNIVCDNNVAGGLVRGTLQRRPMTIDKWSRIH